MTNETHGGYGDAKDDEGWQEADWDQDDWDDDDYDDFIAREFPDHGQSPDGSPGWFGGSGLAPHWRWTAWAILVLLGIFSVFLFL